MKRFARLILAGFALAAAPAPAPAEDGSKEYFVKAAFIYNFIKFTSWPGEKALSRQKNADICVLGGDPFGKAAAVFKEGSTPNLSLRMVGISDVHAAGACHILFISRSEEPRVLAHLGALTKEPVLTVSDIEGFAAKGGMVGFVEQQGKIRFVANLKAAESAGLKLDAQLLEIALSVIR